jgi:hypothetical protein
MSRLVHDFFAEIRDRSKGSRLGGNYFDGVEVGTDAVPPS